LFRKKGTFLIKDYAPSVFKKIRTFFGIRTEDYVVRVTDTSRCFFSLSKFFILVIEPTRRVDDGLFLFL
jgi:hypothetical protein